MKNACIAGVFLHPDRRKNRRLLPVARQPPILPTGHAFSAGNKPPPIPSPAQDAFMHKPADHQPETAAIREKSGKRHRHPEHKPSAIPQSITSPDRSLPPAGYRHFTKPPVPATNGHFLHGCKRIRTGKTRGQTKRREKPGIRKHANRDRTIHHRLFRQCSGDRTFP